MPKKKLSFEQSVKRLEDIAALLEGGNITLEESIVLYKEGITLSTSCRKTIDDMRAQITQLQKVDNGVFVEKPFLEEPETIH